MGRRKLIRPKRWLCEQLSFVFPEPKVVFVDEEMERLSIGHFVGVRMKSGIWRLTVSGQTPISMMFESKTPSSWWQTVAPQEFTLHDWDAEKTHIVSERFDEGLQPEPFVLRSVAVRWLKVFNEAYQGWRMEA